MKTQNLDQLIYDEDRGFVCDDDHELVEDLAAEGEPPSFLVDGESLKNIWADYAPVAHFWAADCFLIGKADDSLETFFRVARHFLTFLKARDLKPDDAWVVFNAVVLTPRTEEKWRYVVS